MLLTGLTSKTEYSPRCSAVEYSPDTEWGIVESFDFIAGDDDVTSITIHRMNFVATFHLLDSFLDIISIVECLGEFG